MLLPTLALIKLGCCSHASLLPLFFVGINLSRLLLSNFMGLEVSPGNTTCFGAPKERSLKELGWQEGYRYVAVLDCPRGQPFCTHTAGGRVTYGPLQRCLYSGWEEVIPDTVSLTSTQKNCLPQLGERGAEGMSAWASPSHGNHPAPRSSNSQSYAGFLSLILKADPRWI